jgi:regulator of cell morphogenesis and NO signaling
LNRESASGQLSRDRHEEDAALSSAESWSPGDPAPGALGAQKLGLLAAGLPGATAVLREHGIDYAAAAHLTLADAAAARQVQVDAVETGLRSILRAVPLPVDDSALALIDYILARFHEIHRRELPELIRLAEGVEAATMAHPKSPRGLTLALGSLAAELESHLLKEERMLFPLMRQGGHPMIANPIACMRHDHDDHSTRIAELLMLADGFALPRDASPSTGRRSTSACANS